MTVAPITIRHVYLIDVVKEIMDDEDVEVEEDNDVDGLDLELEGPRVLEVVGVELAEGCMPTFIISCMPPLQCIAFPQIK